MNKQSTQLFFLAVIACVFGVTVKEQPLKEAKYIVLQTEEAAATIPAGFKEGIPLYLSATDDQQNSLGQFQICTSCTISYMFGPIPAGVSPEKVSLRKHKDQQIDIYFVEKTLVFNRADVETAQLSVTMMIGIIDESLNTPAYFGEERAGSIGLCPSIQPSDQSLLQRQFLYQISQQQGLLESYVLRGDQNQFAIGGTVDEFQAQFEFTPESTFTQIDEILPANNSVTWNTESLSQQEESYMLKVMEYIPPQSNQDVIKQNLRVDTYHRGILTPFYFFDFLRSKYFIENFTCDQVLPGDPVIDPNGQTIYSCSCNREDYNGMPDIKIMLDVNDGLQYVLDAQDYMYMPFLNYTEPIDSRCKLALQSYERATMETGRMITLGQRFFAKFGLMVVYDRENNTAKMAISGSENIDELISVLAPILIGVVFSVVFFGLLLYMINLKFSRIRAEKWLEIHQDVLFGTTWGSMTELEILETLVKNKSLTEMLGQDQVAPGTPSQQSTSNQSGDSSSNSRHSSSSRSSGVQKSSSLKNRNSHKRSSHASSRRSKKGPKSDKKFKSDSEHSDSSGN